MKKTFKHFFCLFVAILCFGQVWADTASWSSITTSTSLTDGQITLSGLSLSSGYYGSSETSSTLSITAASGYTISSVSLTYTDDKKDRYGGTPSVSSDTHYSYSRSTTTGTISLIDGGTAQSSVSLAYDNKVRISAITVTYASSGGSSGDGGGDTPTTYTVTAATNNANYGSAESSASSLAEGGTATITATAESGYKFKSWAVSGTGSTLSSTSTNPTTLTMGTANTIVTATFEEITCPTSGTLFSASVAATSDQSIDAGSSDLVLTAAQATITGGLMSVYNGQSSAKTLIDDVNSTYYFTETNNDTYFKIELDCALQEGDVIQVDAIGGTREKNNTTYELGVWLSSASSRPGSAPAAAGTSSSTSLVDNMINYTVTSSDEYVGKSTFYIYRAYGATQYFGDVTITRPAPAPTTKRIYMKCGSTWCDDNPKFFLNSWGAETHTVVMTQMTGCETDTYYGDIPAGNTGLLFTRQNSSTTQIIWSGDDFWGQSVDITIGDNDLFTCTGWSDGKGTFSAGTYATPSYTISFAGNGSTDGSMTSISSLACGADQAITANAFVKAGYSFANWTADVDVTVGESTITAGSAISDGATLKNISSDITLTAAWKQEVPTSVSVDGTWRCFPGQTITLTATPTGGTSDFTYQWQKYVSTWENIEGATAATYSKENCVVADARSYRCVVSKAGGSVTSDGYDVHIYTLNGNYNGTAWIANDITLVSGTAGKVELTLEAGRLYTFKVKDNFANSWFGNSGYMIKSETGWTCPNNVDAAIRLFTAAEGKYVFDVDIAHTNYETPEVTVGVTYPSVSHPAEGYVYFAKGDYTWTNIAAHWWYWDGETATDFVSWANNPWLTQSVDICGTTYYYMPKLEGYNRVIFHNAEGDDQTSDITVDDSSSGKYILGNSTVWTAFATYTISFAGNGNTSGEMSAIAGICPNANQALTANAFAKTGYNFAGWKADVDVTIGGETVTAGTIIADEATIQNIASSIALTAQWEYECPTEGELFSLEFVNGAKVTMSDGDNLALTSTYATITGGSASIKYFKTGNTNKEVLTSGHKISYGTNDMYLKLMLDCPLAPGDRISFADGANVQFAIATDDCTPKDAAHKVTTSLYSYTVTAEDALDGQQTLYIGRVEATTGGHGAVTITRLTQDPSGDDPSGDEPSDPENVVILAVYNAKYYAMSTTNANNGFTAIEVEYDGSKVTVNSEADKAAIQWTKKTSGDNTTFQDAHDKYMKGADGASMSLQDAACNWLWDATGEFYKISGTSRTFFYQSGVFKNFPTDNIGKNGSGYSGKSEVIAITADNIVITSKVSAELAYNPASNEISQGDAWSAPSLVNPHSVTITSYASDNEFVATVTDGGEIALAGGTGTAHITAHFAGDATYLEGDAVYTITVNSIPTGTVYLKVTATEDITDGEYLIVYEGNSTHDAYAFNGSLADVDQVKKGVAVTIDDDAILGTDAIDAAVFTINVSAGSLKSASGLYIGRENNSNGMDKSSETAYENTFAIADGSAVITAKGGCTLRYNYASDKLQFRYYSSGNQAIQLYKKTPAETIREVAAGTWGTICPQKKVLAPSGASFYTLTYKEMIAGVPNRIFFDEIGAGESLVAGKPYLFIAEGNLMGVEVGDDATSSQDYEGFHGIISSTSGVVNGKYTLSVSAEEEAAYKYYILYQGQIRLCGAGTYNIAVGRAYINMLELGSNYVAPAPGRRRVGMSNPHAPQTPTDIDAVTTTSNVMKVILNDQLLILRDGKLYDTTGRLVGNFE